MKVKDFTTHKTGELVKIPEQPGITHAFVPARLPPKWRIEQRLWPKVAEARAAIAALNGVGQHLPNPDLLLAPLQHREAQLSSQLEGTITNPQQQLLFEMDLQPPPDVGETMLNSLREVANYKKALNYHRAMREHLPLSLRFIRELHRVLLEGVRGGENEPGSFRRVQVQLGRPARFVPPPPNMVPELLNEMEPFLHNSCTDDPLVDAFILHYQLEAIHPFRDGNGRIGRVLLAIMIAERCNLPRSSLYMSAFFDAHRDEYIDRLFNVSTKGEWTEWINFCMDGVISQAKDTELRCQRLLEVGARFRAKVLQIAGSYRLNAVIDSLFISPVLQIPTLAQRFKVTYATARSDVEKLVEARILEEIEGLRPKTFYNPDIFNLIFRAIE